IIQVSNFIGFILEEAIKREIKEIVLLGHVGKLIKVSGGIFHTHNRIADARMEILIANAALAGIPLEILEGLYKYPTVEGAASELIASGHQNLFHILAEKASLKAKEFIRSDIKIGAVFTLLNGDFIGWDKEAVEIILKGGWAWPTL
ncbi:MAG: cobalt-precorrin-5B (C(1))-methyltransferase, partial [Desulfitobacterium hafniense]|nr:cobalt-precorrin-5B (C(1))-methyltransferase [Desulfitobacterium hafniense]